LQGGKDSAAPLKDVAEAEVFLISDLVRSITGVTLPIDAGHVLLPGHNHAPVIS